jgi:hypothetical protein
MVRQLQAWLLLLLLLLDGGKDKVRKTKVEGRNFMTKCGVALRLH